jgi:hypothetical protein
VASGLSIHRDKRDKIGTCSICPGAKTGQGHGPPSIGAKCPVSLCVRESADLTTAPHALSVPTSVPPFIEPLDMSRVKRNSQDCSPCGTC